MKSQFQHAQPRRSTPRARLRLPGAPGKHSAPRSLLRRFVRAHLVLSTVTVLALALVAGLGGNAYAFFSSGSGTGSGSAPTATLQTVTVTALAGGDAPTATLVPGGTADVILRVTNPNTSAVPIYSVTANGTVTADIGHAACTTTGVTFTAPSAPLTPTVTLAPGQTLVHLAGAAAMSTASASACQGATFHIPVTLTVRR